ncbi:probable glycerol-3-phosphate acyltransferase 3 [Argentina anserina]|uniref:probable glycerol-3-phosphate acyltransferase 3 n=1 Tax=Argentina anserina TaxID=57926 RepID=UPI0021764632|nr:probable glycerol-3-phosphate acyltransferase 3 [Potentilla anserina]
MSAKLFSLESLSSSFKVLSKPKSTSSLQYKFPKAHATHFKFQKYNSLAYQVGEVMSNTILFFQFEGTLLKSSSLFPYFMLVAFEASGFLRALTLFLLYPFVCMVGGKLGLNIMVFICFFGVRKDKMRIGNSVLPKSFLEDVGSEGFDVVMKCGKKVAVSDLPKVMVEGFLKDYIGVDAVVARELKVAGGYCIGLMEEMNTKGLESNQILGDEKQSNSQTTQTIGIFCHNKFIHQQLLSQNCKDVFLVSEAEKRNWKSLPREKYPKPLIFHDGRLAFRPTPMATLAMFTWLPLGFCIYFIRFIVGMFLPHCICLPILAFTGAITTVSKQPRSSNTSANVEDQVKPRGRLYVCNHRTLLDPLYVQAATDKSLTAVTYSMSKINEIIAPMKTIKLTRDREKDRNQMDKLLSKGDLVVCPEGTTCREPYLLRFSPLFAELTDDIIPVAVDVQADMFYGSTASGFKFLDPIFHLLNPNPVYTVRILEKLQASDTCMFGGKSRFEVANLVQNEIGKALGFKCTSLTRKDKYMILAGNDGSMKESRC